MRPGEQAWKDVEDGVSSYWARALGFGACSTLMEPKHAPIARSRRCRSVLRTPRGTATLHTSPMKNAAANSLLPSPISADIRASDKQGKIHCRIAVHVYAS